MMACGEGFVSGGGGVVDVVVDGVHVFARRLHFRDSAATDHDSFAEGKGGTSKLGGLWVALRSVLESAIFES